MVSERDNGVLSDAEGGEKPVREQLRKAHIQDAKTMQKDAADAEASNGHAGTETSEQRGRLHRKRSFEEVEGDTVQHSTTTTSKSHTRKRSRDSTAEEGELNNGQRKSTDRARSGDEAEEVPLESNGNAHPPRPGTPEQGEKKTESAVEDLASPKTKRSRLHSTTADAEKSLSEKPTLPSETLSDEPADDTTKEPPATKIPPGSAFANTSSSSPFGALAGSKSPSAEPPAASVGSFASSGFGALAGSSSSGFGALGKNAGGPGLGGGFASGAKSPLNTKGNENPSSGSAFGAALGGQSAFAGTSSTGSAFGSGSTGFGALGKTSGGPGIGGGFGSGLGGSAFSVLGGSSLSSFASGKPTVPLSGIAKPFGGSADDEDDGDDAGDEEDERAGMKSPLSQQEQDKQDERFYEQEHQTGEEDEATEFTSRAKLYNWAAVEGGKKEWRERGIGILRLNVKKVTANDEDAKPTARLLIRADGSHRVVLNTPVMKEISFGNPQGEKPSGGFVFFQGTIDDKPLELMQLKLKQNNALELCDKIKALQEQM